MLPTLPRLSDYEVSPKNGFLPDEIPLDILPDRYYEPWETVVRNFQSLILAKRLRRIVDALPVLETDLLLTEAEWRRAYSILGFIAHGYIWGGDRPTDASLVSQTVGLKLTLRDRLFHHPSPFRICRLVAIWSFLRWLRMQASSCGIGGLSLTANPWIPWTTLHRT